MITKEQALKTIRLTSNENPLGTSPLALKAIEDNLHKVHLYPEYNPLELKRKLAEKYAVPAENIAVSGGSVELIDIIIKAFVGFDEEVLTFERSFVAYGLLAAVNKRKCLFAELTDFTCNINNLFPLLSEKTKAVFISNPNNPTGTIITHNDLNKLLKHTPSETLVVIDEAYFEYVTDNDYPDSLALQKEFPNLIILHTFSKIYGLAGLRVGYAIADEEIVKKLEKNRLPYSVNSLAACAAVAALDDTAFLENSALHNDVQRKFLYEALKRNGHHVFPSQGNFIYMYFDHDDQKEQLFNQLKDAGILVCNMDVFGQDKSLRISVGEVEVNQRIVAALIVGR